MDDSSEDGEFSSDGDDAQAFMLLLLAAQKAPVKRKRGGSVPGKAANLRRDFETAHNKLWNDYFAENPTYPEKYFRRRHRMSRALFTRIMDAVVARDPDFEQRVDALGNKGLSPLQKCCAALRMLVYGCSADSLDDKMGCAESTILAYTKKFCRAVIDVFEEEYLRTPSHEDIDRQLKLSSSRGFPGCIGSLDCMHWQWELCPTALKGQLTGKDGKPSVVLEVVADCRLWIWHFFFGCAGSNNDINIVLSQHVISSEIYDAFSYEAGGKEFQQLYYLVDGIYPDYACFIPTISRPGSTKDKHFAKEQESARKDVKRAFGVLQSRFRILKMPSHIWYAEDMLSFIKACVIMHNMIIEDEWEETDLEHFDDVVTDIASTSRARHGGIRTRDEVMDVGEFITRRLELQSAFSHKTLKKVLIDHLWALKGKNNM